MDKMIPREAEPDTADNQPLAHSQIEDAPVYLSTTSEIKFNALSKTPEFNKIP